MKDANASPFITMYGDRNVIENCTIQNGRHADFINFWGRDNIFRRNVCRNILPNVNNYDNHPDFFQTWYLPGGYGCTDMLIEENIFIAYENIINLNTDLALCQLTGDLGETWMRDFIIRGNIFYRAPGAASNTVENVDWLNNVFYECGKDRSTMPISFGRRDYDFGNDWVAVDDPTANPYYYDMATPITSGNMIEGEYYACYTPEVANGAIANGVEYLAGSGGVTYNGISRSANTLFTGVAGVTTYTPTTNFIYLAGTVTYNGVDYKRAFGETNVIRANATTTFTKSGASTELYLRKYAWSNDSEVRGCVFLDCGTPGDTATTNQNGWYRFTTYSTGQLTGVTANYNMVTKDGFTAVRDDASDRDIGAPGGWDYSKWHEDNGINGGNPLFLDVLDPVGPDGLAFTADDGFQPTAGSPLLGADEGGDNIGAYQSFVSGNTGTVNATTTNAGTLRVQ
jgi:hypothetical protein